MTIDEAIENFRYDAEQNKVDGDFSFAHNNEQVAQWLEELKAMRNLDKPNFGDGYNKAIDDFYNKIIEAYEEMKNIPQMEKETVNTIALGIMEQLKNKNLAR